VLYISFPFIQLFLQHKKVEWQKAGLDGDDEDSDGDKDIDGL
jgi:hypothetical protein